MKGGSLLRNSRRWPVFSGTCRGRFLAIFAEGTLVVESSSSPVWPRPAGRLLLRRIIGKLYKPNLAPERDSFGRWHLSAFLVRELLLGEAAPCGLFGCVLTVEEIRAGEIVIDAVAPFVVELFTKRSQEQPDWTFATGTAIELKGQKLFLTAAHVLREKQGDQPADVVFLPMLSLPKAASRLKTPTLSRS